ncbi:glycosyltransferase family 2 protein [Granulicella tundricola]|uniref:Glycosyl transferase family 2 n=1 Tax=Granulicella tundricola (strain ATCC BAA-1859 / DSM 23138 / MP5ACTX9) TaxID=1198114 RepID=E8X7R5_GRATM|nr:glycosyltransferase family 2 protein [Granulicella tundricola]ADW71499.1 glycosyl transferase family 2 [Granulicella tundricola MP5ACTX9]
MSPDHIDVLIPAYNAAKTITHSILSLQNQTFKDFSVHIVDDGSTDGTGELVKALMIDDPRIRLYSQANNGIVDALNNGLGYCRARYVARLDADDIAQPDRLATQLRFLNDNPDFVAVGSNTRHIDEAGLPTGSYSRLSMPIKGNPYSLPAKEPYIIHPTWLVRRSAVDRIGGYRHVPLAEDSDLLWRLSEIGQLHNLTEILTDYRVHENSLSSSSVVNGRVMAIGSQLAAFSARRRREHKNDIVFNSTTVNSLKIVPTLKAMTKSTEVVLGQDELVDFRACVAAKLLELSSYRPYELDEGDCRYIRDALAAMKQYRPTISQSEVRAHAISAAARLCRAGRWREGRLLLRPDDTMSFVIRLLGRMPVLSTARAFVLRKRRAHEMVK